MSADPQPDEEIERGRAIVRAFEAQEWRIRRLTDELARTKERLKTFEDGSQRASAERSMLLKQIFAVQNVHSEAVQAVCGDGCCHEELGWCSYCGDPDNPVWPCKTIAAMKAVEDKYYEQVRRDG